MACDVVRPKIRPFLDDLLDEADYQGIHAHLEDCEHCRIYASSVGTLSHRIYELGRVTLPPDMVSAILYESNKRAASPVQTSQKERAAGVSLFSGTLLFWAGVLAILLLSVGMVFLTVTQRRDRDENRAAVPAVPAAEPMKYFSIDGDWHYHLPHSSRPEVLGLARGLSLTISRDTANSLIFSVPKAAREEFVKKMSGLHGAVNAYGEAGEAPVSGDAAQVSVYFE